MILIVCFFLIRKNKMRAYRINKLKSILFLIDFLSYAAINYLNRMTQEKI